jgi:hypothetical protein
MMNLLSKKIRVMRLISSSTVVPDKAILAPSQAKSSET